MIAALAALAAEDKKAHDVVVLDLQALTIVTDYFVIASADTVVQVRAVAEGVAEALAEQGVSYLRREGWDDARWVLLDYVDIVVHVFLQEEREYYSLERLWGDAGKMEYKEAARPLPGGAQR